jgi:outer membrane protein TolC
LDLRRLIGGDDTAIVPAEPPALSALPGPAEMGERPERRALAFRLEAANDRQDAASAAGRPQIFLGGGYDLARPNPRIFPRAERWEPSWDASVNLSWTLWDGGRRAAEVAQAAAASRAIEARLSEFDRQATLELRSRALDVEAARAGITTADEGVNAAVEARRVIEERYDAGVATSTEVLDAEIVVLQAELDRTRATASLRIAEAGLTRAAGRQP